MDDGDLGEVTPVAVRDSDMGARLFVTKSNLGVQYSASHEAVGRLRNRMRHKY